MGKREDMQKAIEAAKVAKSALTGASKPGPPDKFPKHLKPGGGPLAAAASSERQSVSEKPTVAADARTPHPSGLNAKERKKLRFHGPKRSAQARDAKMKARGRLPIGTIVSSEWHGEKWSVQMILVCDVQGLPRVKRISHSQDGLFRGLEELDVMFWEWLVAPGEEEIKKQLVFAPDPPKPEMSGEQKKA